MIAGRYLITANDDTVNVICIWNVDQLNVLNTLKHQLLIKKFERIEIKS